MCGLDVILNFNSNAGRINLDVFGTVEGYRAHHLPHADRREAVKRRGPDLDEVIEISDSKFHMSVLSSVLQIQGNRICSQPITSEKTQSFLCWNGEYLNHEDREISDTELIFRMLENTHSPVHCLNSVQGPFSFVFYDSRCHSLWFGKDKVGRRSLLVGSNTDGSELVISSTYIPRGIEIPAGRGIYRIDLDSVSVEFHEWETPVAFLANKFLSSRSTLPVSNLVDRFRESIGRHMTSTTVHAPIGILFSGGLDSMIISSITAEIFLTVNHCLSEIHLINVATSTQYAPDRATGLVSYAELLSQYPSTKFKFFVVTIDDINTFEDRILNLSGPNNSHMDFNISSALWFGGRGKGKILDPLFSNDPEWPLIRSKIISGESVESAVDNKTSKKTLVSQPDTICPKCLKHKLKPGCVSDACKFCCKKTQSACSVHGLSPSTPSVVLPDIDRFLSRYLSPTTSTSDCRILLVGHGADEMFGGYGRHETRARTGGIDGLRSEMILDLSRLWQRNLGRDDRVLADHGRDIRHPFLDELIIDYVSRSDPESMLSLNGSNKPVLREIAREHLGFPIVANLRKRAIQFGTRLAQQTNIKCFGSHSLGSGKTEYLIDQLV